MKEDLDRIEHKIDNLDDKLDNHLDRISRAETSIEWIKGSAKLVLPIVVTALFSIIGLLVAK